MGANRGKTGLPRCPICARAYRGAACHFCAAKLSPEEWDTRGQEHEANKKLWAGIVVAVMIGWIVVQALVGSSG